MYPTSPPGAGFQSTLPARGVTNMRAWGRGGDIIISIHAPREGSD